MFEDRETEQQNTWTFVMTDLEGVTRTTSFVADAWPTALKEFILFLKGNGFRLENDSIGINSKLHPYLVDDWEGAEFYPDDEFKPGDIATGTR